MTKVKITETTPVYSVEEQMKLTKLKQGMIFKFTRTNNKDFRSDTFILVVAQITIGVNNLQLLSLNSFNRYSDFMYSSTESIWQAIDGCSDYTYSDFVVYPEVEIKLS